MLPCPLSTKLRKNSKKRKTNAHSDSAKSDRKNGSNNPSHKRQLRSTRPKNPPKRLKNQ